MDVRQIVSSEIGLRGFAGAARAATHDLATEWPSYAQALVSQTASMSRHMPELATY